MALEDGFSWLEFRISESCGRNGDEKVNSSKRETPS